MPLIQVSRATALDGQHKPDGQNAGLQYLLWYRYHRDLKLSLLQHHNSLAMQYHSLLLLLILSLDDGSAVQVHEPAQQNSSTLQAVVPGLAQGWQAALHWGTLSCGCWFCQTRVGGLGESKFAGRIRRGGLLLL